MRNFDYQTPTRLIFGRDVVEGLPEVMRPFGRRILLTYGGGSIKRIGLYDHVRELLKDFEIFELGGIEPNPKYSTSVVEGVRICKEQQIDVILSVGGGSVLDCSKAIAGGAKYDGETWDLITGKAPTFSLPDMNGKMYSLEDFKGKYLLIDFWASWCAPCRTKNKELNKHYQDLKDMGVNVVSVSLDNDRDKWLKALNEDQVSWLQLVDLDGFEKSKVRTDYKVERVPTVYLIDPEGKVLITNPSLEEIESRVK